MVVQFKKIFHSLAQVGCVIFKLRQLLPSSFSHLDQGLAKPNLLPQLRQWLFFTLFQMLSSMLISPSFIALRWYLPSLCLWWGVPLDWTGCHPQQSRWLDLNHTMRFLESEDCTWHNLIQLSWILQPTSHLWSDHLNQSLVLCQSSLL